MGGQLVKRVSGVLMGALVLTLRGVLRTETVSAVARIQAALFMALHRVLGERSLHYFFFTGKILTHLLPEVRLDSFLPLHAELARSGSARVSLPRRQ